MGDEDWYRFETVEPITASVLFSSPIPCCSTLEWEVSIRDDLGTTLAAEVSTRSVSTAEPTAVTTVLAGSGVFYVVVKTTTASRHSTHQYLLEAVSGLVIGNHPPSIELIGDGLVNLVVGTSFEDPGATASDFEDGDLTSSIEVAGVVDTSTADSYLITYSVSDAAGASDSVSRTVVIREDQPPEIQLIGEAELGVIEGRPYEDAGVVATDPEEGDLTDSIVAEGEVDTDTPGDYTLTFTVKDSKDQTASISRIVTVIEDHPPTIELTGGAAVSLQRGEPFEDLGATASDLEDGDLTAFIVIEGNVDSEVTGEYTLTYRVSDSLQQSASVVRTVSVSDEERRIQKAIIVAGGGPYRGNHLWGATKLVADRAYEALKAQGFDDTLIKYLSAGDTTNPLVDGFASLDALESAILEWPRQAGNPASDVLIYIVDHGGNGKFRLNPNEILTAGRLDEWVDGLQTQLPGFVALVYDACESGSFVDYLSGSEGQQRVVVTSSGVNEAAYFIDDGKLSFSAMFWSSFVFGASFRDAFQDASNAISIFSGGRQNPQLDSNGNGIANDKDDQLIAAALIVGAGNLAASDRPSIGGVSLPATLHGQATGRIAALDVVAAVELGRVWATILPPLAQDSFGADIPILQVAEVELTDPDGDGTWEGDYSHFVFTGDYEVTIFARNVNDVFSIPSGQNSGRVTQQNGIDPLRDTDHDGLPDDCDVACAEATGLVADQDNDNDSYLDFEDAFPLDAAEHLDSDGDGYGNDFADDDDDNDGVSDQDDALPLDPRDFLDFDGDGIGDRSDSFPVDENETSDTDGDGIGDQLDPDDDNDGQPDVFNGPDVFEPDNTVAAAGLAIVDDPTVARRTFGDSNDVDFIQIAGIAGAQYQVDLELMQDTSASGPDISVDVIDVDGINFVRQKIDQGLAGDGESFDFVAVTTGLYTLRVTDIARREGDGTSYWARAREIGGTSVGPDVFVTQKVLNGVTRVVPHSENVALELFVGNGNASGSDAFVRSVTYLPPFLAIDPVDVPQTCEFLQFAISCSHGRLGPGQSRRLVLPIRFSEPGRLALTTDVRAYDGEERRLGDQVPANNTHRLYLRVEADADADGIPDSYELNHNLDHMTADDSEDFDGDSVSNLREYLRGSDPGDVNSMPESGPTISLVGDLFVSITEGTEFQEPGYMATDEEDGDLTGIVLVDGAVDVEVPGRYVIRYSVNDSETLTTSAERIVSVLADCDRDGLDDLSDPDDDNDNIPDSEDEHPCEAELAGESRLVNISTRGLVLTGDEVIIGGAIVVGTEPKTLLIRARGPSLSDFGVPGTLEDPSLQLYSGQDLIGGNDNWASAENAGDIPLSLRPTRALEAAVLMTVNPGSYTAIVRGTQETTGVGIVEIFEVGDTGETRLVNISTRGHVGSGDDVLIGGIIITGDAAKTVTVRARGPSLADFNVPNVLVDPVVHLYDVDGQLIDSNDDWEAHASSGLLSANLRPSRAKEAAITRSLEPGAYTAIVSGAGGTTGIGIVEVFDVD